MQPSKYEFLSYKRALDAKKIFAELIESGEYIKVVIEGFNRRVDKRVEYAFEITRGDYTLLSRNDSLYHLAARTTGNFAVLKATGNEAILLTDAHIVSFEDTSNVKRNFSHLLQEKTKESLKRKVYDSERRKYKQSIKWKAHDFIVACIKDHLHDAAFVRFAERNELSAQDRQELRKAIEHALNNLR